MNLLTIAHIGAGHGIGALLFAFLVLLVIAGFMQREAK